MFLSKIIIKIALTNININLCPRFNLMATSFNKKKARVTEKERERVTFLIFTAAHR